MATRRYIQRLARLATCLVSVCALGGCLGGQTGQPDSATCDPTAPSGVQPDQDYGGITPRALAQAFVGTHRAPLLWRTGQLGAADSQPVGAADEITLVVSYAGGAGTGG